MIGVGFVGIEAFDIILYIARTLSALDKQVLIIDLSETDVMTRAIYHGMDMDSAYDIIHYCDINYVRRLPQETELNDYKNGVVFVVYGFNYLEKPPIKIDVMYIISDSFPSNIVKINKFIFTIATDNANLRLIMRDIVTIEDFERVKRSLLHSWNHDNSGYLYYDIYDYENALKCQISQDIKYRRISSRMKKTIINELGNIVSNIKPSSIRRAFYSAGKGVN